MPSKRRSDQAGKHEATFKKNKKKIYATQTICGICGNPVDFDLKFPHPMSATIDHIIPVDKGGHPSDISNLQLAHFCCNRQKSNKLVGEGGTILKDKKNDVEVGNDVLPLSIDWTQFKPYMTI